MFFLATILNLASSYFIASIFRNFLVIFISFFALVVLNMEVLSLFSAITKNNAFILSILNFVVTFSIFKFKKAKFLKPNFNFARFKNALLLDKSLILLLIAFLIMFFASLFLACVMPVLEPDSQTYHFLRAHELVQQRNLSHFEINDIRALIMPINSEIFYSWMLLFKNNFHGYGLLSCGAFVLILFSMWNIFEKFKYAYRKRLFAIFIFSSFSSVILQLPSLQTDLLVGSLLISAFSLFIYDKIYFSTLALALAMGVKSTGIISLLGFFVLIILYELLIEKNKKINKTKKFVLILPLNFLIFSSYNYILNLIHFNNPLSNRAAYLGHMFWGGIRGYVANLIHFFFQSFDFTGFKWGYYLNNEILEIKDKIFHFIHINPMIGCNVQQDKINIIADEQTNGFGILGFLVFLPMIFISNIKIFFNKNNKTILSFILALVFIVNILILARSTAYMVFSIRFIVAFVALSSIVLIGAYSKKNIIKPVIIFFCLFYMLLLPFHNRRMPFFKVYNALKEVQFDFGKFENLSYEGKLISVLEVAPTIDKTLKEKYPNIKNIAFVKKTSSPTLYLKKMELKDRKIDYIRPDLATYERLKKYDLIILEGEAQNDNVFNPQDIKKEYKVVDDNVIFNSNKNLNCYWVYTINKTQIYKDDANERVCFTYPYLIQNKNFKMDYKEHVEFKLDMKNEILNLYYFINQNKD